MTLGTAEEQQHESVSLFLSLPGSLEQQFWVAPSTQAVLRVFDLIGCTFPLLNIFVAALRRIRAIPSDVQVPYGARIMLAVYLSIHLASLLIQWTRPDLYRTNRISINRLVRLCRLVSVLLSSEHAPSQQQSFMPPSIPSRPATAAATLYSQGSI